MKAREYLRIKNMIKDINKMWRDAEWAILNDNEDAERESIIGILNCMDLLANELDKA